jgi:hypothetical protein
MGQNRKYSQGADVFRFAPDSRHSAALSACPFRADCVAKVVLQEMSKILRAAGALFV